MNYIINQYFHEKSLKNNSDNFTLGIEFFLKSLGHASERKIKDYEDVKDLVSYYKHKRVIDCEKTRKSLREYFLNEPYIKKEINVCYLEKNLVYEQEGKMIHNVSIIDTILSANNIPYMGNVLVNSNYSLISDNFLILGMHEAAHLFNLWHCNNKELCILKEEKLSYYDCFNHYKKENMIPLCKDHLLEIKSMKK